MGEDKAPTRLVGKRFERVGLTCLTTAFLFFAMIPLAYATQPYKGVTPHNQARMKQSVSIHKSRIINAYENNIRNETISMK